MSTRKSTYRRRFAHTPPSKREREEASRQLEALIAEGKTVERNLRPPTNPFDFLRWRTRELHSQEAQEILNKRRRRRGEKPVLVDPIASTAPLVKPAFADLLARANPYRKQALVELVASDVPLDSAAELRCAIAHELARLYECERRLFESERERFNPKWRNQRDLETARFTQDHLQKHQGMSAKDAEEYVAWMLGLKVETLRKRRQRARKRKQCAH